MIIRSFRNFTAEVRQRWPQSWPCRHPIIALGLLGALLQCAQFGYDREYWMDEGALEANIVGHSARHWSKPLTNAQLAPIGFLTAERMLASLSPAAPPRWLLRLLALAAGLSALAAIAILARDRGLASSPDAGLAAMALLACSPAAIYFSSELKPYIIDVAGALWVFAMALAIERGPSSIVRWMAAAIGGAILVWFSFSVAFALAAVGLVGMATECAHRRWGRVAGWAGLSTLWLASFAIHGRIAHSLLGGSNAMWAFWRFAFPDWPTTWEQAAVWPRMLLNLFVNPLGYGGWSFVRLPFLPVVDPQHAQSYRGMPIGAVPALAVFAIGVWAEARSRPAWLARLLIPIALGVAASALRLYPMHGRLALFVLPSLILLIASGVGAIARRHRRAGRIALWILLAEPLIRVAGLLGAGPIQHGWNSLGDLE